MRVLLAAVGSRGDTVPFGALAARMQAEGHDVLLLTHASLVEVVPPQVPVVAVPSDPASLLAGPAGSAARRGDPRALNRARGLFADFLGSFAQPTADALDGVDVLVASTFAMAAADVAMSRGVPVVRAHLWPESPDLAGPMPLLPYGWALPHPLRRWARRGLRGMEAYLAGFIGWWERGRLRLRPYYPAGFSGATLGSLYAVSPALVPTGELRGCVTGWWWTPGTDGLSPQVEARLTGGGPWVYVGFGSMHQSRPQRLLDDVAWAARRAGVRAVVQLPGAEGLDDGVVHGIGAEPHRALFAQTALVVHHGGSGTTGAAVRAGVPSVVVPHFADQYYWGHRLRRAGVATRSLPRALLRRESLARRIDAGLEPALRRRAADLGARVSVEDGTGVATRYVEGLLRGREQR